MKLTRVLLGCALLAGALPAQHLSTTAERYFNIIRRNLETSADVMPAAEKYSFRLTPDQMTFAEWLNHSTQRNYTDCSLLKSEPTPDAEKKAATLKEKADVAKALKDSFAYCAEAVKATDDQKAISSDKMSNAYLHIVVHNNEIYGNIIGYMRVNGIVPPSTAARADQKKN